MALLTSFRTAILQWLFEAATAPTLPANWQVALYVGDPQSGGTEVGAGVGYSRQTVTRVDASWTGTTTFTNANLVAMGTPTGSWGSITHFAYVDGSGNAMISGALAATITPSVGNPVEFASGALTVTVS